MIVHDFLVVLLLGIVESITEFFPISSTGHIILINDFLKYDENKIRMFDILIQTGSVPAIVIMIRKRIYNTICAYFGNRLFDNSDCLKLKNVLLASVPSLILGLVFYKNIQSIFTSRCVIYSLIAGGILLIISEKFKLRQMVITDINGLSCLQSFLIGCFQCLSLFPGFSRLGASISGGLLLGFSRNASLEFSLILSLPMKVGAAVLDFYKNLSFFFYNYNILVCFIGLFINFIVSIFIVNFFLKLINRTSFVVFGIYRGILAVIAYSLLT